jgi:hypothetical protein
LINGFINNIGQRIFKQCQSVPRTNLKHKPTLRQLD